MTAIKEAHNRENLIVMYENNDFILARLKCQIPKDTFTNEWFALYRQKEFALGSWVVSGGTSLQSFKDKAIPFRAELKRQQRLKAEQGNNALWIIDEFLNERAPDFIKFFDWIDTLQK